MGEVIPVPGSVFTGIRCRSGVCGFRVVSDKAGKIIGGVWERPVWVKDDWCHMFTPRNSAPNGAGADKTSVDKVQKEP